MERCKHDLLFCSECNTFGGDSLPQYETGTETEVLKIMADLALQKVQPTVHSVYAMPDEKLKCEALIRDFKKLGGIDDE